jgi:hypothetical protein
MTRVLDLADVLQLIIDTLDQYPLPEQHFVEQQHELVFHLALDELQIRLSQLFK